MGWEGSGAKYQLEPDAGETRANRSVTLFAYAPGAVRYEWTCDGEPIPGGENGELVVTFNRKKAKAEATETYTATAYYTVDGVEVKGTTTSADVTHKFSGLVIHVQ